MVMGIFKLRNGNREPFRSLLYNREDSVTCIQSKTFQAYASARLPVYSW